MERMNYGKIQDILNECNYEKEHLDFDKIGNKLNEGMGMPEDRSEFRNKIIDAVEGLGLVEGDDFAVLGVNPKFSPFDSHEPIFRVVFRHLNAEMKINKDGYIELWGVRAGIYSFDEIDRAWVKIKAEAKPTNKFDTGDHSNTTFEYYTPRKLKESKFVGMIYNLDNSWDTFYIDEDGEMVDSIKLAKVFDDEDEAEEWAYENRPVGWGAYGSKLKEATIPQAKRFAARKHGERGQTRRATGLPYIVHPEGVAALVKDAGGDDEQVQAAWLHDTMEDTGTTYDDLVEKFGKRVADLVASVTNDPYLKKENKEAYMSNKLEHLPHDALLIKLCDMRYNISDFCPSEQKSRIKKNITHLLLSHGDDLKQSEKDICHEILSED